ncbi:MAG: AAA family ATPase [Bacteroidales bacterium]|nr:AAA family ATPase [Bacteroidales bacterium]
MIDSVNIKNFKSIEDLTFDLGRINVIIGANGSGKTNILEAIVMGAAASSNKLDYEFLGNRMRVTSPDFMKNAFENLNKEEIQLGFKIKDYDYEYVIREDIEKKEKWVEKNRNNANSNIIKIGQEESTLEEIIDLISDEDFKASLKELKKVFEDKKLNLESLVKLSAMKYFEVKQNAPELNNFLIYTPEYSFLRKFEESAQIIPIGIKGEGLFHTLKQIILDETKKEQLEDIKESLRLLDWFEDFELPNNLMSNEFKIGIKDKYINQTLNFFDQRSANEGFLYLLFYLVLFTSDQTPKFFAIDNIETGFNPKLCTELIKILNKLAIKYDKQVIFTTHNPAILDGLDLKDDMQRLFITDRNKKGATYIERIESKPQSKMKLSELWTNGIIGGIPDNF